MADKAYCGKAWSSVEGVHVLQKIGRPRIQLGNKGMSRKNKKITIFAEAPQKESKMNIPSFPDRIERFSEARAFFNWLRSEGVLFHPDDPFENYVDSTGQPSFTPEQAKLLNRVMRESFAVLGEGHPQPDLSAEIRHKNRLEIKVVKEMRSDPVKFKNRVLDFIVQAPKHPPGEVAPQGKPWTEGEIAIVAAMGEFCDPNKPGYDENSTACLA